MRYIALTEDELKLIESLFKTSDNSVERERCMFLKLSVQKKSMVEIARLMNVGRLRVTAFFDAWEQAKDWSEKVKTLRIKKGRGAKLKLEKFKEIIPVLVKENSRNLNVILGILERKHQIKISKSTLKNFLK
jgi:transposase